MAARQGRLPLTIETIRAAVPKCALYTAERQAAPGRAGVAGSDQKETESAEKDHARPRPPRRPDRRGGDAPRPHPRPRSRRPGYLTRFSPAQNGSGTMSLTLRTLFLAALALAGALGTSAVAT